MLSILPIKDTANRRREKESEKRHTGKNRCLKKLGHQKKFQVAGEKKSKHLYALFKSTMIPMEEIKS